MAFVKVQGYYINTDAIQYVVYETKNNSRIIFETRVINVPLSMEDLTGMIDNAVYSEQERDAEVHFREHHKYSNFT